MHRRVFRTRTPRRRRQWAALASVAAAATLAVTACSSSSPSSGSSTSNSGSVTGSVSGTLTIGIHAYFAPTMQQLVTAYEKATPGVNVQVQQLPNDNTYQTKLLTEKLGGSLPDIVATYDALSSTLATDGVVQSLSPYMNAKDLYPTSYFLPNFLSSYISPTGPDKGEVMGLPQEADATVVYYNKNEFAAAGLPAPAANWTWAQMLADSAKLAKSSGGKQVQWGMADTPDWQAVYNPLIKLLGGTAFSATSAGLDTPAAQKAWQMLIGPTQTGQFVPYSVYAAAGYNAETLFQEGVASMYIGVRAQLPAVRTATQGKFDFDVASMPTVNGTAPIGAGSIGWALSSQAKNIKLSLNFLKWLYSGTGGMAILEKSYGVVPAIPSLSGTSSVWRSLPAPPATTEPFVTAAAQGLVAPNAPGTVFNQASTDIPKAIEAVVDNHESISSAFASANSQINASYSGS